MTAAVQYVCDTCSRLAEDTGEYLDDYPPGWADDPTTPGGHICPACQKDHE